jgi:hydrogenase maturation protein HypF
MLCAIADAVRDGASPPQISRRFHTTMIAATVRVCQHIREATARNRVVLSGGVFQNRLLTEGLCNGLSSCGFQVYTHRQVPPNDGGLALGQAAIAGRRSTAYVSCRTNAGC